MNRILSPVQPTLGPGTCFPAERGNAMTHTRNTLQLALVAALIAALAGCDSGKAAPAAPFAAAQGVEVRVAPGTATIARGASTQLNALVTGASVSTVSW